MGTFKKKVEPPVDHRQKPPDDGADHKGPCHDHREDTHRFAQLVPREGVDDDNNTIGDDDRPTDCLEDAEPDELGDISCKSAEERAEGKDCQARNIEVLAPVHISKPSTGRGKNRDEEHITDKYPGDTDKLSLIH